VKVGTTLPPVGRTSIGRGMISRFGIAVAICICVAGGASAQVVRFETTMGDFDMVLNPTHNAKLQGHVDNMLDYIERESYKGSWINRADTGFVLQMGGFYSMTKRPPMTSESVRSVQSFTPVQGEPAAENPGLSNTVGTVSLALSGNQSGTNQNSGTTSFFVNLGDNSGLDADFTVFAAIPDMTVINQIMALTTIDRSQDPMYGADPQNLSITDVPVQADGKQVFIKRAFVVADAMTIAQATSQAQSIMAQSASNFADSSFVDPSSAFAAAASPAAVLTQTTVPEPASIGLAAVVFSSLAAFFRYRRRRIA
jgi:cyclophilin family peptidyl-prolyl cis-trans isomerase